MEKEQKKLQLADQELDMVYGGAKTLVEIDDTEIPTGGLKIEIDGELVTLINDGDKGFYYVVHGKEYKLTNEEVANLLHEMLNP